jgi:tRNA uridine 5-carboxymethylaminomethyl modification enzyme
MIREEIARLRQLRVTPTEDVRRSLQELGSGDLAKAVTAAEILQRPELTYRHLPRVGVEIRDLPWDIERQVEIEIKFAGYLERERRQMAQMAKLDAQRLPEDLDYGEITGLRTEAAKLLQRVQPLSVGQAARIPGIEAGDISILQVWLMQRGKMRQG